MTILSLDTSSAAGSAALVQDGAVLIERAGDPTRLHGERLPRELMDLLAAARLRLDQIDGFAVATGPGSFTGLRVGIATIQGLALAQATRVVPVSTFEALAVAAASRVEAPSPVAVWIDAYRGEVFAAVYDTAGRALLDPTAMKPDATLGAWHEILRAHPRLLFAGDGAVKYRDVIETVAAGRAVITPGVPALAGTMGLIAEREPGRAVAPHAIVPLYVRRSDAELARDRSQGA